MGNKAVQPIFVAIPDLKGSFPMKKILFSALGILFLFACQKSDDLQSADGPNGGGPGDVVVVTESVTRLLDGTVECRGRVVSGMNLINPDHVGFAAGGQEDVPWHEGKKQTTMGPDGRFSVTYQHGSMSYGLATHYYRAWAIREGGYGPVAYYGEALKPTEPVHDPFPCEPDANTFELTGWTPGSGSFYHLTLLGGAGLSGEYRITGSLYASQLRMYAEFNSIPLTGIYLTRNSLNNDPLDPQRAKIWFDMGPGTSGHLVDPGQEVYVTRVSLNEVDVVLCGRTWGNGAGTINLHFRTDP